MDAVTLTMEKQQVFPSERQQAAASAQETEITPLPEDSFKLIGGGEGIVVL